METCRLNDILLVDDDPWMIQMLGGLLDGVGHLRFATSGSAALRQARDFPPDLMLLDARMPDMSGYEVCKAMKADPLLSNIPVIFVTGDNDPEFELEGLALGAADFITKPFSPSLLMARVTNQLRTKHLTDQLRSIATIDALTGLANRRAFDEVLARESQRQLRSGLPMSLLMIDVDHFKLYNDRHGHPAGDECLRAVAQAMRGAAVRCGDLMARIGGEEFALLLPETPREGALHIASGVLASVAAADIPHGSSPTADHVTVSIGIGCVTDGAAVGANADTGFDHEQRPPSRTADLVRRADRALYAAKRGGRARVRILYSREDALPAELLLFDAPPGIAASLQARP